MIKTTSVFILGAGASVDYQFPTARGLKEKIVNWRSEISARINLAKSQRYSTPDRETPEFRQFYEAFRASQTFSIDRFLLNRPEFMEVGKYAIAHVLTKFERMETLLPPVSANDWYSLLWNVYLHATKDRFRENKVTFVTFNYDRSLEQFLMTATQNLFGVDEAHAVEMLSSMPIYHVHGRLGYLHWQRSRTDGHNFERAYNHDPTPVEVLNASQCIRIAWEEVEQSDEMDLIKKAVHDAERVFFVGFGFDDVNMKHFMPLRSSGRSREDFEYNARRHIAASGLNLSPAEREKIKGKYGVVMYEADATGFLRQCVEAIAVIE